MRKFITKAKVNKVFATVLASSMVLSSLIPALAKGPVATDISDSIRGSIDGSLVYYLSEDGDFKPATDRYGNNESLRETTEMFDQTGVYEWVVPETGRYRIKLQGGAGGGPRGNKGSSTNGEAFEGYYTLMKGDTYYIAVGGNGDYNPKNVTRTEGGWNGGGDSYTKGGSGGGATAIYSTLRDSHGNIVPYSSSMNHTGDVGLLSNYSEHQTDIMLVAGGGGGAYFKAGHPDATADAKDSWLQQMSNISSNDKGVVRVHPSVSSECLTYYHIEFINKTSKQDTGTGIYGPRTIVSKYFNGKTTPSSQGFGATNGVFTGLDANGKVKSIAPIDSFKAYAGGATSATAGSYYLGVDGYESDTFKFTSSKSRTSITNFGKGSDTYNPETYIGDSNKYMKTIAANLTLFGEPGAGGAGISGGGAGSGDSFTSNASAGGGGVGYRGNDLGFSQVSNSVYVKPFVAIVYEPVNTTTVTFYTRGNAKLKSNVKLDNYTTWTGSGDAQALRITRPEFTEIDYKDYLEPVDGKSFKEIRYSDDLSLAPDKIVLYRSQYDFGVNVYFTGTDESTLDISPSSSGSGMVDITSTYDVDCDSKDYNLYGKVDDGDWDLLTTNNNYDEASLHVDFIDDSAGDGEVFEYTVPKTGEYILTCYGAGGTFDLTKLNTLQGHHDGNVDNFKGNTASGRYKLEKGQKLYIYLGSKNNANRFNGGGDNCTKAEELVAKKNYTEKYNEGIGETEANTKSQYGSGATDIRIVKSTAQDGWSGDASLKSRLVTAGGGAGKLYERGRTFTNATANKVFSTFQGKELYFAFTAKNGVPANATELELKYSNGVLGAGSNPWYASAQDGSNYGVTASGGGGGGYYGGKSMAFQTHTSGTVRETATYTANFVGGGGSVAATEVFGDFEKHVLGNDSQKCGLLQIDGLHTIGFAVTSYNGTNKVQGYGDVELVAELSNSIYDHAGLARATIDYVPTPSNEIFTATRDLVDKKAPNTPEGTVNGNTLYITDTQDNGSVNAFKVNVVARIDSSVVAQKEVTDDSYVYTSGVTKYRYYFDDKAENPANTSEFIAKATLSVDKTDSNTSINFNQAGNKYIHVQAVDKSGNASEFNTFSVVSANDDGIYGITVIERGAGGHSASVKVTLPDGTQQNVIEMMGGYSAQVDTSWNPHGGAACLRLKDSSYKGKDPYDDLFADVLLSKAVPGGEEDTVDDVVVFDPSEPDEVFAGIELYQEIASSNHPKSGDNYGSEGRAELIAIPSINIASIGNNISVNKPDVVNAVNLLADETSSYTVPTGVYSKPGATLKGYNTKANGTGVFVREGEVIKIVDFKKLYRQTYNHEYNGGFITLYAVWENSGTTFNY